MQEHTSPATPSAWDEIKRQKTNRTCGCGMILYISLPSYTSIPYLSTSCSYSGLLSQSERGLLFESAEGQPPPWQGLRAPDASRARFTAHKRPPGRPRTSRG